jgi:16S rRNA (cytosine967-C5)-methyltransferase
MATDPGITARTASLEMLAAALSGDTGWTDLGGTLEVRDAAFARRLAFGVLRWYGTLDWLAGKLLAKPMKARDQDIRHLLLLGLHQLWHEDLPGHAAVHATAECARTLGKPWAVGLVNAVLRRFQREMPQWTDAQRLQDQQFAHPDWLLDALRQDWPQHWQAIAQANNQPPPLWLRCNTTRLSRDELAARFAQEGVTTQPHPLAPDALQVLDPVPVQSLPGFSEGWFSVQDAAAQLAAPLLSPAPGMRILDACAAPGGKTGHLLELAGQARVTALDISQKRLSRIAENLARLGLDATLTCGDATEPSAWWDGEAFDRILLDAPCSATGVIRRHPEIKWLRDPAQVQAAAQLQARLLDRLWPLLQPDGILVYATCSVLNIENSQQINAFLERQPDARCIDPGWSGALSAGPGRQWLPGTQDMDGFFYALLQKQA